MCIYKNRELSSSKWALVVKKHDSLTHKELTTQPNVLLTH